MASPASSVRLPTHPRWVASRPLRAVRWIAVWPSAAHVRRPCAARALGTAGTGHRGGSSVVLMSAMPTPEQSVLVAKGVWGLVWPIGLFWLAGLQKPVGDVPVQKSDEEWAAQLSPMAYKVLVKRGTERAFTSPYDKLFAPGMYACAGCGEPLFSADTKFNSGTGWPSYYDPVPGKVDETLQLLYCLGDFGARECRCATCGGHLGHMFTDGPKPTGKRYCINGVALSFIPASDSSSGSPQ